MYVANKFKKGGKKSPKRSGGTRFSVCKKKKA